MVCHRETVALEDPNNYFLAFDTLTSPSSSAPDSEDILSTVPSSERTAEQTYQGAITRLTLAGLFADPGSRFAFDMSLSLHAATPAIEAFYQYYADMTLQEGNPESNACLSWVDIENERICDSDTLNDHLKTFSSASQDLECALPPASR